MSAFDGEIELQSVYMVDFKKHEHNKSPRPHPPDDDCLIVGFSRDSLKPKEDPQKNHDILCPLNKEHYKKIVQQLESTRPKVKKLHFEKDIDPLPIEHEIQDLKRTEYLTKYCSRDLPFMSVNLARRARALQTLRLPDDVDIPATTHGYCYRPPGREKIVRPSTLSMRPKFDPKLKDDLQRILGVQTGESTYSSSVGLLGQVVLKKNPYGPPREEPAFGKWLTSYPYTYRL